MAIENPKGRSYLLSIITNPGFGSTPYFLAIWVDQSCTFKTIDQFLRNIWLGCCEDHPSFFRDMKETKLTASLFAIQKAEELLSGDNPEKYYEQMESMAGHINPKRAVAEVFHKNQKINYQYDLFNDTKLQLKVLEEYVFGCEQQLQLLSRNEPLTILCDYCQKATATEICPACSGWVQGEFCKECSVAHKKKCSSYSEQGPIPLTNSPRSGTCNYKGGVIDLERDKK